MNEARLAQDVSFDLYVTHDDIAPDKEFPPQRFSQRDERLALLNRLWAGNFTDFLDLSKDNVSINYFHSYSTRVANLLTMNAPTGNDEVTSALLGDVIIDLTRFGGAVLVEDDAGLTVVEPQTWYPVRDGSTYFLKTFTSDVAITPDADRVLVTYIDAQMMTKFEAVFAWEAGKIGPVIDDFSPIDTGQVIVAKRSPSHGIWGTAKYLELAGPIIEIVNRATRNSRVLDLNGRPVPVVKMADQDAESTFNVDEDNDTSDVAMDKIERGLVDILDNEFVRLPDDAYDFDFKQPNVEGVRVSLEQIDAMQKVISQLTGLPSLSGEFQPPSGEALKRELLPFYAETSAMQSDIIELLAEYGYVIEWEHVFDVLEAESTAADGDPNRPPQGFGTSRDGGI